MVLCTVKVKSRRDNRARGRRGEGGRGGRGEKWFCVR